MDTSRTEILISRVGIDILENKHVIIVGCGGVGGYVAILLVRAGIGKITLIDFDKITSSNINRQIIANTKTEGLFKVDVLKQQLLDINPKLSVIIKKEKLNVKNVSQLITDCDICVDAIDSVEDKVSLICYCKSKNISIISAMGAGNRFDIPRFYLTDIYKTHDDGLAKAVRKKLRDNGIDNLEVITTDSIPVKNKTGVIGSISYYPAMCGVTLAAVIINKFLKEGL